ncbi:MAG: VWA domain-containing protein [Deltaproteobacteria bacterium]|nr:VWA domain-containing protein [Deltaproteobacteria bacterium]
MGRSTSKAFFSSLLLPAAFLVGAFAACGTSEQTLPTIVGATGVGGSGGGGDAGGTGGAGGEGGSGPEVCPNALAVHAVQPAQSNLLFLVDRSGSMHIRVGSGGDTRWSLTKAGLYEVFDTLPPAVVGGLSLFPWGDKPVTCCKITASNIVDCNACANGSLPEPPVRCDAATYANVPVPLAPLDVSQLDLMKALATTVDKEFYWGTPLAPAVKGSIDALSNLSLPGVSSIVVLTDGQPTSCDTAADPDANDIQRAIDAVTEGVGLAIRTYVVGVYDTANGANPEYLSYLAHAAGTDRYPGCEASLDCAYPVNAKSFATDFSAAMSSIALEAMNCSFDVPETMGAPDYDKVNLTVESKGVSKVVPQDTTHADGWDYLAGKKQVQLYGAACQALKDDPSAKVTIVLGCETVGN